MMHPVVQIHAFGGAGCVTFWFTSADAGARLALADLAYAIDHPASPADDQYVWCNTINCPQPRTIPVDATVGLYYFNLTDPNPISAALNWTYILHPKDSTGMLRSTRDPLMCKRSMCR